MFIHTQLVDPETIPGDTREYPDFEGQIGNEYINAFNLKPQGDGTLVNDVAIKDTGWMNETEVRLTAEHVIGDDVSVIQFAPADETGGPKYLVIPEGVTLD